MISAARVRDILGKGIVRFQKPYDMPAIRIQLVMYINTEETVMYVACVDGVSKNTVLLKDLIGKNVYNNMVADRIKKLITALAEKCSRQKTEINLFVDMDIRSNVHIWIREKKIIIREVTDAELTA